MKRYINSAIILLAVLALASCSKTDEFQYNLDDALQIESVSGISPFSQTTKSVITEGTLPSEEASKGIGLFVTASDGGKYDGHDKGYSNVNFTFSSGEWSTQAPVYLSNTTGKLYGYFPYNSNANDLTAVPVQSSLNGTDYLYAEPKDVSHSNRSVSLTMNHALSRLHLTIRKGASFSAGATLSKIALKSTAIDATGTMDITTGAVSASKESSQMGTVEFATDGSITAEGIVKDILLVPADNSEGKKGITISLVINGESTEAILTGDNGIDIRSGIQYNLSLTLEDTGIRVEGIGVGVWGEGGSQTVEVGGHKVTVKLDEDITPHDVLSEIYTDDNNVIVRASSFQGKVLICNVVGNAKHKRTATNGRYNFTISEINSNIEIVLGYAPKGTLPGEFSVGSDKKVLFAQGNLYWHNPNKVFLFEENQYSNSASAIYIGHFYWSKDPAVARAERYNDPGAGPNDNFFTNSTETKAKSDFTVGGVTGKFRTLSCDEKDYLLYQRTMTTGKSRFSNASSGVKIDYETYYGLFIYPDDYSGEEVSPLTAMTWQEINEAGIVFLPSASYREGNFSPHRTTRNEGYYWLASPNMNDNVDLLYFCYDRVEQNYILHREAALSVRLVTDIN